jgi:3-oxoacyl-[acyl-carrier protein] reductase
MTDLAGKAILVTGSTRGIGKAIAGLLASEGAVVGIQGRDIEDAKAAAIELSIPEKQVIPLSSDFTKPEDAAELVRDFAKQTGRIDGLVNNAGSGKAQAFRSLSLEKWRATFSVNLEAAFCATHEAYGLMRKAGQGSIVNIASIAAHGPGKWMGADSAASKAGLVSLTMSLALEAARFGIRVNAVSPGMVETDMTAVIPESNRKALNIPVDRFAEPEEIANTVAFLLSEQSSYITGQVLHVNGGLHM